MEHTVIVAGLGRCGTSLVMQMLDAAGVPCVGTYPAFEDVDVADSVTDGPKWIAATAGKAVKVLDPQRAAPPRGPGYRIIWLTRGPEQQARSMLKMADAAQSRQNRLAMARSLRGDAAPARRAMQRLNLHGRPILDLSFEWILSRPSSAAEWIALHCGLDTFDVAMLDRMAECVIPRSPDCLPGFLELALIERAEARAG